jgi:hypothetical protein
MVRRCRRELYNGIRRRIYSAAYLKTKINFGGNKKCQLSTNLVQAASDLILRKLEPTEVLFKQEVTEPLDDAQTFSPKGTEADLKWLEKKLKKSKEVHLNSYSYGLIPMENLIVVYTDDDKKVGLGLDDDRIEFSSADNAVEGQWDNLR